MTQNIIFLPPKNCSFTFPNFFLHISWYSMTSSWCPSIPCISHILQDLQTSCDVAQWDTFVSRRISDNTSSCRTHDEKLNHSSSRMWRCFSWTRSESVRRPWSSLDSMFCSALTRISSRLWPNIKTYITYMKKFAVIEDTYWIITRQQRQSHSFSISTDVIDLNTRSLLQHLLTEHSPVCQRLRYRFQYHTHSEYAMKMMMFCVSTLWGIKKHTKNVFTITSVKLSLESRLTLHTTEMSSWSSRCCQPSGVCQGTSFSSRTAHLHTVHGTPSSCYDVKLQTSLDRISGQRTHQTSIQSTTGSGGWYKNASTRQRYGTSMTWSSALPVSGLSWSRASLIKLLNSGGQGWEPAFAQRDSTSNSC